MSTYISPWAYYTPAVLAYASNPWVSRWFPSRISCCPRPIIAGCDCGCKRHY